MHDARRGRAPRRQMAAIDDRARGPSSRTGLHLPRYARHSDSADLRPDRGAGQGTERYRRAARRRAGLTVAWNVRPPLRGTENFPFGVVMVNVPMLLVGSVT